jgi:undecaprenyl-diphosphatase
MPSSHAVNNFAAVAFFILLFPSWRTGTVLFIIAFLVAVTRPYLGLHYPSDVVAGILIGLLMGYIFAKAFLWSEEKYFTKPKPIA